jgi:PGF-CTERM protein
MKRLGLLVLLTLFLSIAVYVPVSAEAEGEYKAGCPEEAKAILDAVGGCDAIDCSEYSAICEMCCPECSGEYPEACKTNEECEAKGLYWYDDECHAEQKPSVPGFEAVIAIAGLLAVAYLLEKRRK